MLSNEALYFLLDKIYDKEYEKYIEIGIVADDDSRIESYQKCIDFLKSRRTKTSFWSIEYSFKS